MLFSVARIVCAVFLASISVFSHPSTTQSTFKADRTTLYMEGLDDDFFENYKGGLMAKVLEKDASLTSETNRLWTQILDKWYTFDYSKKAADQLRSIQKEDVINFYKTYLQQSSPKRRRLATRVWGCNQRFKRRMHEARRFALALSLKGLKALLMCKSLKTLQPSRCRPSFMMLKSFSSEKLIDS